MPDLPQHGDNATNAARDIAWHLHPFTNMRRLESEGPLVITGGRGIHVTDEAGREYIDAMAALWCVSLGFSEKRLAEAAYRQMLQLPYASTFGQRSHPAAIALAEKLIALMPVPMSKVFFNNSGSEANDTAVKLVWYYNNAHRPAAQEEDHRADEGLSRRHRRLGQPDGAAVQSSRFRPADRRHSPRRLPGITIATPSRARARRTSPPAWPRTSMP